MKYTLPCGKGEHAAKIFTQVDFFHKQKHCPLRTFSTSGNSLSWHRYSRFYFCVILLKTAVSLFYVSPLILFFILICFIVICFYLAVKELMVHDYTTRVSMFFLDLWLVLGGYSKERREVKENDWIIKLSINLAGYRYFNTSNNFIKTVIHVNKGQPMKSRKLAFLYMWPSFTGCIDLINQCRFLKYWPLFTWWL